MKSEDQLDAEIARLDRKLRRYETADRFVLWFMPGIAVGIIICRVLS